MRALKASICGATLALAALTSPAAASEGANSRPYAGMDCEVHVWSIGRPNFVSKSNAFVKYTPPTEEQLADPHSTVNIFNMSKRAMALGDEQLSMLFPGANSVNVVRHPDMIDRDVTPLKSFKGRIGESDSECYGDLVVRNLYALFPNPDAPYQQYGLGGGVIASVIAGGDRLVIDFWFRQWPGGKKGKPLVVKRKNDTPLPHVAPESPDMLAAVTDSANLNLEIFAETVAKKRK
ncbi:hypothetical protein [Erythrobacter sp. THAF29]|uniref:hypothetical protein n=1 Tax=Erythrobacter sp. THAF29 TaxID=2587851 RepID=UPI001269828D|nr:hypothetical protein [Erythrobacter sp. THAF29]QFT76279.1 hypothetical protein FIU90_01865 [Erythrobacter sp. THAF29]